ncbi:MAG: hypothetical protein M1820_006951 [Bogoriella megaspora]|nr:MAG: hypothetical protein M1820_006951 [Bogoriella megaspora]
MNSSPNTLAWSHQYSVSTSRNDKLVGDKIILPPSALEQLLAAAPTVTTEASNRQPYTSTFDPYNPHTYAAEREAREFNLERNKQLPHPLTFRLVNPDNGRVVHAGIREFSAEDDEIILSPFLADVLGIRFDGGEKPSSSFTEDEIITNRVQAVNDSSTLRPSITIHAKQLARGKYVKLRPLEAGYDPENWKSLLEQHMRANYTTLTNGEVLSVPGDPDRHGRQETFRFLVDGFQPEDEGICIVDTDLEVDIEALNEEQARETLRRIAAKQHKAPGTTEGSSTGGPLDLFNSQEGQVREGDYVDYQLASWNRSQPLEIRLTPTNDGDELELFVNPVGSRLQVEPRDNEYVFADFESRPTKRVRLEPSNVALEDADALWVSVHAPAQGSSVEDFTSKPPKPYKIRATAVESNLHSKEPSDVPISDVAPNPNDVRCKNCHQFIPSQSLLLHENFCYRNNILCPKACGQVFQKRSPTYAAHWHCPYDTSHGNTPSSFARHNGIYHTTHTCPHCPSLTFPSLPQLAQHRTTTCPGKLIICRFCHLRVPQEGDSDPNAPVSNAALVGLTPHEFADGGRTTECHICGRITRLRDMEIHLKHHELDRLNRPAPKICRNANCGRTMGKEENELGICGTCFGPLYVAMYDPDGKALKRRVERRYLTQLVTGCGKGWCRNEFCKTGKKHLGLGEGSVSMKDAMSVVKPVLERLFDESKPLHFCTDEASQKRRTLAEMLAGQGEYRLEWCVKGLEEGNGDLDKGMGWLRDHAPKIGEGK